jgi:hypothetical protein
MSSSTFDDLVESGCDALRRLSLELGELTMEEPAEASPCKYFFFLLRGVASDGCATYLAVACSEREPATLLTR